MTRRYIVYVHDNNGDATSLIVPFAETSSVQDLCQEAKRRAERNGISLPDGELQLRLFAVTGSLLDPFDTLQDVVHEQDQGKVYLTNAQQARTHRSSSGSTPTKSSTGSSKLKDLPRYESVSTSSPRHAAPTPLKKDQLRLRVITPALARKYQRLASIPVLEDVFSTNQPLSDIKSAILTQLGLLEGHEPDSRIVDMYIQDVLIETTKLETALHELALETCLTGNVLNVFTISRAKASKDLNKDKKRQTLALQCLPSLEDLKQTNRGCSSFLASLKVFQARIKSTEMDEEAQETLLHAIYQLTRFFPILKVIRSMMSGNRLTEPQAAMLTACFHELLKEMMIVPNQPGLIGVDEKRVFEGSRLFFGYLFESTKQVNYKDADNKTPIMSAYKTVDFTDAITGEKVEKPMQCGLGMVDESTLATNPDIIDAQPLTDDLARIFLLSGGKYEDYSYFPYDQVLSAVRKSNFDTQMVNDLPYLSLLCASHGLAVTVPADLHRAEAPCLSLDEDGDLSTYIGRPPCAGPGEDYQILISTTGREENIDVAKMTQALEPILEARKKDGTIIFEATGSVVSKKQTDPSELIMFVVDRSRSMDTSSEFQINDQESRADLVASDFPTYDKIMETLDIQPVIWTESLTLSRIQSDPSFEDMVAIVRTRPRQNDTQTRAVRARLRRDDSTEDRIIDFLILQERRLVEYEYHRVSRTLGTVTDYQYNRKRADMIDVVKNAASKIRSYGSCREAIRQLFNTKASERVTAEASRWIWRPGGFDPNDETDSGTDRRSSSISFEPLPTNLICPITHELFRDPVRASDGIIYDRQAINRWFESSEISPSTGLKVDSKRVRVHETTLSEVRKWVAAEDIILGRTLPRARRSSTSRKGSFYDDGMVVVSFHKDGVVAFTASLPENLSLKDLYKVTFRQLRGLFSNFSLYLEGRLLEPNDTTILAAGVVSTAWVTIVNRSPEGQTSEGKRKGLASKGLTHHLFKVYDDTREKPFLFGFWLPIRKYPTACGVVFKCWRYFAETRDWRTAKELDLTIWGKVTSTGDNRYHGTPYKSWDILDSLTSNGSVSDEKFYEKPPTDSGSPRVYKLLMADYHDPQTSSRRKFKKSRTFTRLDVSKEIFSSFVNRTLAYNYPNHCGLLPFSTEFQVTQEITHVLENFRDMVMRMTPDGDTALWDALDLAINKLNESGRNFPNAKKRIVCFSDGCDTSSATTSSRVLDRARYSNIVIDSFCLGSENHSELMWVSHNTGGYKFQPASLEDAMGVGEMEPVLSLLERAISRPWRSVPQRSVTKTPCTRNSYPERKPHPNVTDAFTRIDAVDNRPQANQGAQPPNSGAAAGRGNLRTGRILSEIRSISRNPHPYYDVYVSDSNMGFWKIIMQGPPDSAYSSGTFVLYLDMDDQYPLFGPKARFITPILHPNINKHGRVCHSIFDRKYSAGEDGE
ncbi:hypothetical protein ABW19_dt0209355 [Dactylella cylindrospora]|nr:hypothetical protein ABW19_dt0209355 [Dactylella cylindrospora]